MLWVMNHLSSIMSFLLQVWVLACSLHVWAMSHLSSVNDLMGSYIIFNDLPCLPMQVWALRQLILSTVIDCDSCCCLPLVLSYCRCLIINYMFYFSAIYHLLMVAALTLLLVICRCSLIIYYPINLFLSSRNCLSSIHSGILVQEGHISLPSL